MTYIQLTYSDLILPALLVVMDGVLSLTLRLKLERQLAIATVRMVVQLVLVGYVLTFLFAAVSPLWTGLAAFIMVIFASREIVVRQKRRLLGFWTYGLGAGCRCGDAVYFCASTLRSGRWAQDDCKALTKKFARRREKSCGATSLGSRQHGWSGIWMRRPSHGQRAAEAPIGRDPLLWFAECGP